MKLGVDIDGTIKQTQHAAVEVFNRVLGRNVRVEDVKEFYLDKAYGLTGREGARLWRKLEHEIYQLGKPFPHAAEILRQLVKEGHEVVFITARPGMQHITEVTQQWLTEHGFPYDGHNLFMGAQDKGKVAKREKVELFFEDAPAHLDRLVAMGIPTIIMDAPYNRDYPKDLPRMRDWMEGLQLIHRIIRDGYMAGGA